MAIGLARNTLLLSFSFLLSKHAFAGSQGSWAELAVSQSSSNYSEAATDIDSGTTTNYSDMKIGTKGLRTSLKLNTSEMVVRYQKVTDSELDFWASRTEVSIDLLYHFHSISWISPILGLYRLVQTPNAQSEHLPTAMVTDNRLLVSGLNFELIPWIINGKHQVLLRTSYRFLTALDKLGNQGSNLEAGLGYLYPVGKLTVGLEFLWNNSETFAHRLEDSKSTPHPFQVEAKSTSWSILAPLRFEWNSTPPARKL